MVRAAQIFSALLAAGLLAVFGVWYSQGQAFDSEFVQDLAMIILCLQPVALGLNFWTAKRSGSKWKRFAVIYSVLIGLLLVGFLYYIAFGAEAPGQQE
jgi:hypothetical protein